MQSESEILLRRECNPCSDGQTVRRHSVYANASFIRIPKTEVFDLLRNDIQLCSQKMDENEDFGEPLSEESVRAALSGGEGDGRFVLDDGKTVSFAIMHCVKARAKGQRLCVMIPFERASALGIPGTTLSLRRMLRSLLEYGQDKETTANDIKQCLLAMKQMCSAFS